MEKVTKKELAAILAEKEGLTKKDAEKLLNTLVETVIGEVKDGKVVDINGFGKFLSKHKEARKAINPRTKEEVEIPAKDTPAFKPAKAFKEAL